MSKIHELYANPLAITANSAFAVWREEFYPELEDANNCVEAAFLFAFQLGSLQGSQQKEKEICKKLTPLVEKLDVKVNR